MTTDQFAAQVPQEPPMTNQVTELSALSTSSETRQRLSCKDLLLGETRQRAEAEATKVLQDMLSNTQVLAVYGNDALKGVNDLNDKMLREHHPEDMSELEDIMKQFKRRIRDIGRKYDPSQPKNREKYENVRGRLLGFFHLGKTFLEELMDDVRSMDKTFDWAEERLNGKQQLVLRNVSYFDTLYDLNEKELGNLIYVIAIMEIARDRAAEKAEAIPVGDANAGDRGGERKSELADLVSLLENKIAYFKVRLFLAWSSAPQIRLMRKLDVGLSLRIDMAEAVAIPSTKGVFVQWIALGEAEQAQQVTQAVEDLLNEALTTYYDAASVVVPEITRSLETPPLDPRTVAAVVQSFETQADGIIQALELGRQKRAELEQAILSGRQAFNDATGRVNEAQLDQVLAVAREAESPLEIAHSVPSAALPSSSHSSQEEDHA